MPTGACTPKAHERPCRAHGERRAREPGHGLMATLVVMRHARAARPVGVHDHERPLTASGEADASLAGQQLASMRLPQPLTALVSSATRTCQTWTHVRPFLPDADVVVERDLYEAGVLEAIEIVQHRALLPATQTVLLIGHNPTMHEMVLHELGSPELGLQEAPAHEHSSASNATGEWRRRFPTSAFAVIDYPEWEALDQGGGVLRTFSIPRA